MTYYPVINNTAFPIPGYFDDYDQSFHDINLPESTDARTAEIVTEKESAKRR